MSSDVDQAISYIFTWHSHHDGKTCETCLNLDGKWWTGQDLFQERLYDPIWGDVWDLDADHSLAHGAGQYHCRCQLEVRVEFDIAKMEEYVTFEELIRRFTW